jgi:hypothetical protein
VGKSRDRARIKAAPNVSIPPSSGVALFICTQAILPSESCSGFGVAAKMSPVNVYCLYIQIIVSIYETIIFF